MNYNSIVNVNKNFKPDISYNNLDIYNLKNNIYSTVKPEKSLLVNKNIENYFNEIINVSDKTKTYKIVNKTSFFYKFYKDYVENNMLLIFIIFIIIIFLTIRYYTKDIENEYFENNKKLRKNSLYNKKINNLKKYKKKLDNQKEKLNNDKQQILSIIDELSNINYELDTIKSTSINNKDAVDFVHIPVPNNSQRVSEKPVSKSGEYNDKIRNMLKHDNSEEFINKTIGWTMKEYNNQPNQSDLNPSSKIFYDINKKLDDSDLVQGMYVEPPYM